MKAIQIVNLNSNFVEQTDFQPSLKASQCALTITEAFVCITALDDYLKIVGKSGKKHLDQKKKTDGVELLNGAKSTLAKAIQMAGSPIAHQKAVLSELLSEKLFSFNEPFFSSKPEIFMNRKLQA